MSERRAHVTIATLAAIWAGVAVIGLTVWKPALLIAAAFALLAIAWIGYHD